MSLLTDQEKHDIRRNSERSADPVLEAIDLTIGALLQKLAAGVSVEPVAVVSRIGNPSISWRQSNLAGIPDRTLLYPASAIAATRVQENERCAKVCEAFRGEDVAPAWDTAAAHCVSAIRALIGGPSHG